MKGKTVREIHPPTILLLLRQTKVLPSRSARFPPKYPFTPTFRCFIGVSRLYLTEKSMRASKSQKSPCYTCNLTFRRYAKTKGLSDATFNPPRDDFDLYTPRFVKGRGTTKVHACSMLCYGSLEHLQVGLCPCCMESQGRGGEDKKLWLSTKFSAFKWCVQLL